MGDSPDFIVMIVAGDIKRIHQEGYVQKAMQSKPFVQKAGTLGTAGRQEAASPGFTFFDVNLTDVGIVPALWPKKSLLVIVEKGCATIYLAPQISSSDRKFPLPAGDKKFYEIHFERIDGADQVVQLTVVHDDR